MAEATVLHQTIHSSKWVALGNVSSKLIGIVSFLVLARLLDPQSYGLIAIILMLVGVFNRMVVSGFETAVIQNKERGEKYLDVIWTFNIIKNILIFVIIYFAAPLVAAFFHAEQALTFIRFSGIFILIPSLVNIKQIYLFKDFQFNKLYFRDMSGQVAYVLVGALYAILIKADVGALFFANVAKYVAPTMVLYYYYPERPKFAFNFRILRELTPYSKWITAQNLVNYLTSISDNFLVGRLLNPLTLGYYSKARNLSGEALTFVGVMIKNLAFVAFSKVQGQAEKIISGFMLGLDLVFFFGLTNIFIVWLGGDAIIQILLGDKWLGIVPALKIFTFFAFSNTIVEMVYSLFDGSGKPSVNFKLKVSSFILYSVLVYLGIQYKSMVGAALAVALSNLIIMFYALYKLKRVYALQIKALISRFLLVFVPFVLATLIFAPLFFFTLNQSPILVIIILLVYYAFFLLLFWLVGRRYQSGCLNTIALIFKTLFAKNKLVVAENL